MVWDLVMQQAVVPTLEADPGLIEELGDSQWLWPADESRTVEYDSVEWSIIADNEDEVFNRLLVTFDIRMSRTAEAPALLRAARVERRIRRLLTRPDSTRLNNVWVNGRFSEARTLPAPERDVAHRQLDILLEPLRERYAAPNLA